MQFGEFGDHLVHQTTLYTVIDMVGFKANMGGKRIKGFSLKIRLLSRETVVLGPQSRVVVAPKGPPNGNLPWEELDKARRGAS